MTQYNYSFSAVNYAGASTAVGPPKLTNPKGALLMIVAGVGDYTPGPQPTAPAGYSASVSPNVYAPDLAVYLRIALAANESPGTVNWEDGNPSYAYGIVITPVSGVLPPLNTLINAKSDWSTTGTVQIAYYGPCTPTAHNCDVLALGHRVKSSASNGATIGNMVHDTAFGAPLMSYVPTGSSVAVVANVWGQSAPTATNSQDYQALSIADSSLGNMTVMLALNPPAPVASPITIARRMPQRFYSTDHYPR